MKTFLATSSLPPRIRDAQLRLRRRGPRVDTNWRKIERNLIDFFRSRRVPLANGGGMLCLEVVCFKGSDDCETDWISLEDLARHLARELS
jgi:hypothetical protein